MQGEVESQKSIQRDLIANQNKAGFSAHLNFLIKTFYGEQPIKDVFILFFIGIFVYILNCATIY